jgi:predicted nucleic acid-binding Zn ribbon protein
MKRDIAREIFRTYKSKVHRREVDSDTERSTNEEPTKINAILGEIVEKREWRKGLAEGNLFSKWREVVGDEIAANCEPITLFEGRLTLRASSTAWATQLRLITPDLLRTIQRTEPGALVEELQVLGPTAPSWRRGVRTIKGARGPRDTYG